MQYMAFAVLYYLLQGLLNVDTHYDSLTSVLSKILTFLKNLTNSSIKIT